MRLTIVNQFYVPDLAPTAHMAASLAEHRAALGDEVTVITGTGGYVPASVVAAGPGRGTIRVVNLWTPALGKTTVVRRLSDYVAFLGTALARLATLPRQDVVVSLTTPPFVVVAAVAHKLLRRRARVVLWCMDCYPDVVERLGPIRSGSAVSRALRALNRWVFRRIDHLVCLDGAMLELVLSQYCDGRGPRASVIPNWEPLGLFTVAGADAPRWPGYDEPDLEGRFTVLYLGNLGYGHPIDTAVGAAGALRGEKVAFLFVGGGARWDELAAARDGQRLANVVLHPYVTKEETRAVMAGAGCALIILADTALGVMSPSKLHANLAMGLPVVYVGPAGSNVDEAIVRFGCGVRLAHGDVAGLANVIRRLRDDGAWRDDLSARARLAFEADYCDVRTLPQFDDVLTAPGAS